MQGIPPTCDDWVRWLHDYWQRKRPAPGVLPGRQHIDPLDFPQLLRWIWLADVHRAPLRFKYRLIGTVHVAMFGRDYTGHWIHEVLPMTLGTSFMAGLEQVANDATIYYERSPSYFHYASEDGSRLRRPTHPERLFLPLARDGRGVDMILAITISHAEP
jgi:hypothetical protein